jgi:HD-GYP domain-containing protein (c-di-GMP phosphodiesterase class II)
LAGSAVPQLAQIVGVVDVFDALTSRRPYRGPLTADAAARHLFEEVEKGRMSRHYVEAFLDTLRVGGVAAVH